MGEERTMSDATPETAPATDDQGNADPVVPTDTPAGEDEIDLTAQVADLEAAVAEKDARIADLEDQVAELEADPYRPVSRVGTLQYPSERVTAFEENEYQAAVAGWERTWGNSPVQAGADGVEV